VNGRRASRADLAAAPLGYRAGERDCSHPKSCDRRCESEPSLVLANSFAFEVNIVVSPVMT
jgi:hypothetical protein